MDNISTVEIQQLALHGHPHPQGATVCPSIPRLFLGRNLLLPKPGSFHATLVGIRATIGTWSIATSETFISTPTDPRTRVRGAGAWESCTSALTRPVTSRSILTLCPASRV